MSFAQVLGNLEQAAQPLRVVRVIDEDAHTLALEAHQPAEVVSETRSEVREHARDARRGYAERRRRKCSAGEVRDVVDGAATDRERHRSDCPEIVLLAPMVEREPTGTHPAGRTAALAMRTQRGKIGIEIIWDGYSMLMATH